jgi:hypothetical protein
MHIYVNLKTNTHTNTYSFSAHILASTLIRIVHTKKAETGTFTRSFTYLEQYELKLPPP